jgi:hypothetical protein
MPMPNTTENPTGLALAIQLCEQCWNDHGANDSPEKIAAAPFAVVIERDEDSWVFAAASWEQVAGFALACLTGTEGYDEWIEDVYDVATGEVLSINLRTSVTLTTPDGRVYVADDTGVSQPNAVPSS